MKNTIKKLLALVCCLALSITSVAVAIPVAAAEGLYFNITDDNRVLFVNVDQDIEMEDVAISVNGAEYVGNEVYWWPVEGEVLVGYNINYYGDVLIATKAGVYTVEVEDDEGMLYDEDGNMLQITVVAKNPEDDHFVLDGETIPAASLAANPDNYVPTEPDPEMASYESQKIGVMSDVHIQVAATNADYALKAALTEMKAQGVSAVLFTGDMVNTGIPEEYAKFNSIWDEVMGDTAIQKLTITGNHEFEGAYFRGEKYDKLLNDYLEAFGLDEANFHEVINGIHVIGINSEDYITDGKYTLESMMWLEEQLMIAKDEDPYAPIIVMCHQTLANTTYGSDWGSANTSTLYQALRYYPQVIYLAGHSHFDFTNERSIMQDKFTCIDVPSMQHTSVETASGGSAAACYDYQNYLILEVDGDAKKMNVNRYKSYQTDMTTHAYAVELVKEPWSLDMPLSKSGFDYKANRADTRVAPTFAEDAQVEVSNVTSNTATITFPAASHDDYVHAYTVDITDASGDLLVSQYVVSDFYKLGDKATSYTVELEGMPCNTACLVNVSAMESFGKVSAPLTAAFTTAPITTPSVAHNVADFFDVNVAVGFEDNSPYRRSYNLLDKHGPVHLEFDEELNRQVASMGYWVDYAVTRGSLKEIADSFTAEVMFKTPENMDPPINKDTDEPAEKEAQCVFGNRENGGFALEFKKEDDTFQACVYINGEAQYISAGLLDPSTWYHAVLTFDGEKLALYLDGALIGEVEAAGLVTFDPDIACLAIGGDLAPVGGANKFFGSVALARIYTTVQDVAALTQYDNNSYLYNNLYKKWLVLDGMDTSAMSETHVAKIAELKARANALLKSAYLTKTATKECLTAIDALLEELTTYGAKNAWGLLHDSLEDFTKMHDKTPTEEGLQWENNLEIKDKMGSKNKNEDIFVAYKLPGNARYIEVDVHAVATECVIDGDLTFFLSKDGKTWVEQPKATFTTPTVNPLSSYWMDSTVTAQLMLDDDYSYVKVQLNKFGYAWNDVEQKEIQRVNFSTVLSDIRIWYAETGYGDNLECTDHIYDNACDADCNDCGVTREPPHQYDDYKDAECNLCGHTREVSDVMPGDVNGDGKVNVRDIGALQQSINGWDVSIIEEAADVNGDGKVNVRDLGVLQQYINGWDVDLK